MAKFYVTQIKLGKITIDEVPERWRKATEQLMEKEE